MKQLNITQKEYRDIEAISNSELLTIERNPSDFIWAKNAPVDSTKTAALDFGTMLHTALLEPEQFNKDLVIYDQTKSRETVKFNAFMQDVGENAIVLLESEYDKIRLMIDSAKAHPTFSYYLSQFDSFESSIVGEFAGVQVKIRPDCKNDKLALIGDLKSTADLSAWREAMTWKNPLFTYNYGHTAAFYMEVYSKFLGKQVNEYHFLVCQKNISMGRYPVDVISITREECERYGFIERVYTNLEEYQHRVKTNDWLNVSRFPSFKVDESITIEFED